MPALTLTMGNLASHDPAAPSDAAPLGDAAPAPARARALLITSLGLLVACGGGTLAPAAPTARHSAPLAATAPGESFGGDWAERTIWRVPLRLALPSAPAWHASTSGTFTLLEHAPTRSTLALRVTLAPRLVRPEQCEADARIARPSLPLPDPSTIVERRKLVAPAGFDVRLVVGVEPVANGVRGYALAFGAAIGRCYVAAFETTSGGAHAAELVAERLAVAVSGILETVSVPNADQRVSPPIGVK